MFRVRPVNLEPKEKTDHGHRATLPKNNIRFQVGAALAGAAFFTYLTGHISGVFDFGVFLPLAGAGVVIIGLIQGRSQIDDWRLNRRERLARIRRAEAEALAAERQADFTCLAAGSGYAAGVDWRGGGGFFQFCKPTKAQEQAPSLENLEPALPLLAQALAVALVGAQNGGKTTLMQHIMDHRGGRALAIDPHGYADKYGSNIPVVGIGKNYHEINQILEQLLNESQRRYRGYRGQRYPQLSIYIDETTLLKRNCSFFEEFQAMMFSEGRKIGFCPVFCIHTQNIETWGLSGKGDLADGVLLAKVRYDEKTGQRWCDIAKGLTKRAADFEPYSLPGPHPLHTDNGDFAHEFDIDPGAFTGTGTETGNPEPEKKHKPRIAGLLPLPRRFFSRWIDDCCELGPDLEAQAGPLYLSYRSYCERHEKKPLTTVKFGKKMAARFKKHKRAGRWFYQGIKLKDSCDGWDS